MKILLTFIFLQLLLSCSSSTLKKENNKKKQADQYEQYEEMVWRHAEGRRL